MDHAVGLEHVGLGDGGLAALLVGQDDGGKDVFVHASAVEVSDLGSLNENQKVSYEIERDSRSGKESAGRLKAAE